ncbi:MAG: hypothetical protein CMJ24_06620 [Phycisphaerae bacterium]|nr:hypothetical protein [Phycisphaerae bacterium]|tara:strand:- start:1062 stop:1250 length:189 start_codon:yes stop_codon:yes gene_type:complete
MGMDKQMIEVELKAPQIEYLEEMAKKYAISDIGKALRCLVDHARSEPDQERFLFEVIRCINC